MTATQEKLSTVQIATTTSPEISDPAAERLIKTIQNYYGCTLDRLQIVDLYTITKTAAKRALEQLTDALFLDSITQVAVQLNEVETYDWMVEVSLKKGVTDNAAATAEMTIADFLGEPFFPEEGVTTAKQYWIRGNISEQQLSQMVHELLANALIHKVRIEKVHQHLKLDQLPEVEVIDLFGDDKQLMAISKERLF